MDKKLRTRIDCAANASLFMYAISAVALPVCLVMIKEELGFSLTQAGILGFVGTLMQFIILVLSGFVAARYGKLRVIKTALVIVSAGLLLFTRASSYVFAVCMIPVIGLGTAFLEALLTPLVEDLYPEDNGSKQNLLHAFWPVGILVGTLSAGEILSRGVSWRWVFAGIAVAVFMVIGFYPSRDVVLPRSKGSLSHFWEILRQPKFWVLGVALFFAGGAEGGMTFWIASYIQLNLGGLPRAGGIGIAVFALGMFIGRYAASRLAMRIKLSTMIQVSALLAIFAASSFFLVNQILTICCSVFLTGITVACFWPSLQTYAARMLPVDPTLLMILMSCLGLLGYSSIALVMGIVGDHAGLRTSFVLVPVYLAVLLVLTVVERFVHYRKPSEPQSHP